MRQYRGLTKDGKWVYGFLISLNRIMVWDEEVCMRSESYEVIPETVGQQTGKEDEEGKEIYEGDIIEYYSALVPKGTNPTKRQTVKWNKRLAGFVDCFSGGKIIGNIHQKLMEKPK